MSDEEALAQLVVVGASAGGVEALSKLLSTLLPSFPAPIVVAQHLDPRRPSRLAEVLTRRSPLAVRSVEGREPLQPGTVYLVPSNRQVEISNHSVSVTADAAGGPKPSIDRLLASAAKAFGERVIAVILTGMGSDGAFGAQAVKEAGGTVVVQNPATASFPGLPRSLPPSTVDIVADVEAIGPLLHDLLSGAFLPKEHSEERILRLFLDQLRQRSGVDFSAYKRPTILRRLQRRVAAVGLSSLREYARYVETHPEEQQRLVSNFLIKVTEFLRDPDLFAHLREHVLPRLVSEARERGHELRIWSAGCSTGEEAYSLAMLVADVLGDDLERFSVRIFATDLDEDAVQFARRGVYPPGAVAHVAPQMLERYLARVDDHYEVKQFVRNLLIFGQHDLGQRAPFPRIDLALCRNVLIYFTPDLQKRALQLFGFALREGGCLVLGTSETTNPLSEFFVLEDQRLKIYRRQGATAPIPTGRTLEGLPTLPIHPTARRPTARQLAPAAPEGAAGPLPSEFTDRLLHGLPIGVVVVDRRYDVQRINPTARRLLGIHRLAVGDDLIHLSGRLPQSALRATIDAAFRGEITTLDDVEVDGAKSADARVLRITCAPHPADRSGGKVEAVQIVVVDQTAEVQRRREAASEPARGRGDVVPNVSLTRAEVERLTARVQQLEHANRELLEANHELIAANTDLSSARDAFLISNEEAQAALEEVETLNEEQQATNEELETLNEELQATIEELNTTNEDLGSRDAESREMAASLADERARLSAVLAGMGDAVVVVDRAANPVRTNAAYDRLFAGRPEELAQGEDGRPLGADEMPQGRAARGESFTTQFTLTAPDGSRRWFEANGQPIRSSGPEVGVVVVRDITERSLRRFQEEFVALATHELRTPLTVIRAYLQRLIAAVPETGDERAPRRMAAVAEEQTRRLAALVRDLHDVTRLQSGDFPIAPEMVDLRSVVGAAVETARALAGERTINFEAPREAVQAHADPGRLQQVALNLLTNALQHAPDSERIDVRLRRAESDAELQVQDHGHGIPAEHLPHIFSRFYRVAGPARAESTGLGLGLPISRAIVAAHGGTIQVSSAEGQGTTFTVRLPLPRRDTAAGNAP
ncbi:MAG TPA: chemotaxis protein CheB [Chloroflexota bacterium]|nr:chemotaxis protein CheB [Chloroflexota bacterium]